MSEKSGKWVCMTGGGLNRLLVTCQIDNTSPGGVPGGKSVPGSQPLTRDVNLDTLSYGLTE